MLKIPYEQMLDTIRTKAGISPDELNARIQAKLDALSGLISREGAAHIVANELNVNLVEGMSGKLKIGKLVAGMRSVETLGKVLAVYETREYTTQKGSGKVGSLLMGDETGRTRLTFWQDQTDLLKDLDVGNIVLVRGAYSRENQGRVELHMGNASQLIKNPPGETVEVADMPQSASARKRIDALKEQDMQIELFATVVQAFDPRFFEVCDKCGKRSRATDGRFVCEEHGEVKEPAFSYVMNAVLDDGSNSIRSVFFRDQMLALLGKSHDDLMMIKDAEDKVGELKSQVLGLTITTRGRVNKNALFDRIEFVTQDVNRKPDIEKEIALLS